MYYISSNYFGICNTIDESFKDYSGFWEIVSIEILNNLIIFKVLIKLIIIILWAYCKFKKLNL